MFKVGDWVKVPRTGLIIKLSENEVKYGEVILADSLYKEKDLELWQPKVGEYCWFWNKGASKPTIGQFESKHTKSSYNMKNSIYYYDYCEPFIGTLPSLIKEKQCLK